MRFLSVKYSMPENLVNRWLEAYGEEKTEMILAEFAEGEAGYCALSDP